MFRHEDFGRQLIWALRHYVSVDIQGPDKSFFEEEIQEPSTVPGEGTNQHNEPLEDGENGSDTIPSNAEELPPNTEELPPIIQDMLDPGVRNLDKDDIIGVSAAIPMIDNDNKPAPENLPSPEDLMVSSNNAMGLWSHSGICQQKSMVQCNANPELTFWTLSLSDPSKLNLFERLFFRRSSKQQSFSR